MRKGKSGNKDRAHYEPGINFGVILGLACNGSVISKPAESVSEQPPNFGESKFKHHHNLKPTHYTEKLELQNRICCAEYHNLPTNKAMSERFVFNLSRSLMHFGSDDPNSLMVSSWAISRGTGQLVADILLQCFILCPAQYIRKGNTRTSGKHLF